jgi:hypothetical protein
MSKNVDVTLQKARVLEPKVTKYEAELRDGGFPADDISRFRELIEVVEGKAVVQKGAVKEVGTKTDSQDAKMLEGQKLIQKFKDTVKDVFAKNKGVQGEFHVGRNNPQTVSAMTTELEYFVERATKYKTELGKRGIKQIHIDKLQQIHDELIGVDTDQEDSKKTSKAATQNRNTARTELAAICTSILTTAANVFEDNLDILLEFGIDPNKKRKSRKKKDEKPPTA